MSETLALISRTLSSSSNEGELKDSATTTNSSNSKKFEGDGLPFKCKLIGTEYLSVDRDEKVCLDSMFKLKAVVKTRGEHKQRVQLNLTMSALKVIDEATEAQIAIQEIERISFVVIDPRDTRAFGYIYNTSDGCHQFWAIKTERAAATTVFALKELFELAFEQYINSNKAKEATKETRVPSSSVSTVKQVAAIEEAPPQGALVFSPPSPQTDTNTHQSINVRKGDLTTEQTDVIVVCSSSQYLLENIFKVGGDAVMTSYNNESKLNSSTVTAVVAGGRLLSKKVYFLSWRPNTNETLLCESLKKFVSNAIEKATTENYQSIAFPAIGCGRFDCSISLVAKTLVEEAHRLVATNAISVSFIIQPDKENIFHEFQKQIDSLEQVQQVSEISTVSMSIGKGMVVVEKGNIISQKVDAIVVSSSSEILKQVIVKAAGLEVKAAYESEYKHNPNSILISTISGQLCCKRIFFLKWQPNANDSILRQSVVDFIWNVIQHVVAYNYESVAFPAIGCGKHGCSIDIVVKTMVKEIKKHLEMRNLSLQVKFVIQPEQQNVYDEFCKQVLISDEVHGKSVEHKLPATWKQSTDNRLRLRPRPL
ncbi:unnamed protein product [Rotaria sordida]|uniref:Macro domain-containing protein n=1 Tax=Rotaria sordida TaxID=392033 RepID=A0A815WJ30_9BILA|nr:unnamed protein product [Rotaria sordida]CAF1543888.1 unnamed protein product [Rotaria sordida]